MNFAYQALVLFVYVLPGIIFRKSMSTAGSFRQQRSLAEELAQSVLFAAIAHAAWIPLANLLGSRVDLGAALMHAMGQFGEGSEYLDRAVHAATEDAGTVVFYFLTLNLAAWLAGFGVQWMRTREMLGFHRLGWFDDEPSAERFRAWGRILVERRNDAVALPVLATVVNLGKSPYLYVGILEEIQWAPDGNPEGFILSDVMRRPIEMDAAGVEGPEGWAKERFYQIAGDRLIIRASEATTLNILIYYVTEPQHVADVLASHGAPTRRVAAEKPDAAADGDEQKPS